MPYLQERKRRRRLSGFKGDLAPRTPSRDHGLLANDDAAEKRAMARVRTTSINRAGRHRTPMRSASRMGTPFIHSGKFDNSVDDREVAHRYQQIMDIFARGKINQKNAWGLKLMENMERMIDVEAKDNFKKCSATIAAAATIYKHRVDDVYKNTFRMLSNFTVGAEITEGAKVKRRRDNVNTLLSATQCRMNHRLVVSEVDPMFHKTTSAFDEGGSHGLLLNNLRVQSGVNVIFDSSTPLVETQHPDDMAEDSGETSNSESASWLKSVAVHLGEASGKQPICPRLQKIIGEIQMIEDEGKKLGIADLPEEKEQPQEPMRLNFNDMNDTMDFSNADDPDALFGRSHVDELNDADMNERALQSMNTFFDTGIEDLGPSGHMADYDLVKPSALREETCFFNPSLLTNWTGPEQWIYRRQQLRRRIRLLQKRTQKKPRKKDRDFLNFSTIVDGCIIADEQFKAPKKEDSTMFSDALLAQKQENFNVLPEDLGINRGILTKLFMKPSLHVGRKIKDTGTEEFGEFYREEENSFDDVPASPLMDTAANQELQWMDARDLMPDSPKVNFAKVSSKINVKRLKDTIFHHIRRTCLTVPKDPVVKAALSAAGSGPSDGAPPELIPLPVTDSQPDRGVKTHPESTSFSQVLKAISRDSRQSQEISVPFAFMGVLHLANVKKLRLSRAPGLPFGTDFMVQVDEGPES